MKVTHVLKNFPVSIISCLLFTTITFSQNIDDTKHDWEGNVPDGCTTIMVGKLATFDGSVMTSHTDDSHRTRSWMDITAPMEHSPGEMVTMYKREKDDSKKMPTYEHVQVGEIPQVEPSHRLSVLPKSARAPRFRPCPLPASAGSAHHAPSRNAGRLRHRIPRY